MDLTKATTKMVTMKLLGYRMGSNPDTKTTTSKSSNLLRTMTEIRWAVREQRAPMVRNAEDMAVTLAAGAVEAAGKKRKMLPTDWVSGTTQLG